MDAIQLLSFAITKRAQSLGLTVVNNPAELARTEMPAETLSQAVRQAEPRTAEASKGAATPGVRLFAGPWSVIIGSLGSAAHPSPATIIERWREHQRTAAIARTSLDEKRQDDLVLLFVGPPGSEKDAEWTALSSQIERNDLVCRKLVWLPPQTEGSCKASLQSFLRRTFLARPWHAGAAADQPKLDAVADLGPTLTRWQAVLDDQPMSEDEIDYDALVGRLIREYKP
jgi:hypothetical protein